MGADAGPGRATPDQVRARRSAEFALTCLPGTRHRPRALRLGVDQHEEHPRRLRPAVDPRVVGAALDQHVAGFEHDLLVVEQHLDLAGEADAIVDRVGAVLAVQRVAGLHLDDGYGDPQAPLSSTLLSP